jgi:uncharacterized protein (DUF58 family)
VNRLLLLGALVYILILLGFATVTGAILGLVIPILVFLGSGLLYGPLDQHLSMARFLNADRIEAGDPVIVTLRVTNEGQRIELLRLQDSPPAELELLDGDTAVLTELDPGQTVELQYSLQGRRGRYDFGKVRARSMDLLGVLQRETKTNVPTPFELLVYPEVLRIQDVPIRPRQTKAYAGPIPARMGGSGIGFFGTRTYQQGDALRHINWRAIARHPGSFFTNEFELERVADVGIILDARRRTNVEIGGHSLFESGIHAAASLSSSFLKDGNRVALLLYGGLLDWTVPGYGKLQQERILRSLSRAQLGDSMVFDKLDHLPTRLFPAKSQIILVSPLDSGDAVLLPRLRRRGYQVLIISPDPISFELSHLTIDDSLLLAARIVRVERELLLRKLRLAGIQVVNWQVDIPLDQVLRASQAQMRPMPIRAIGAGL